MIELVKKVARKAWKEVMKIYDTLNYDIEFKSDNSPFTIADKISNEIILEELEKTWITILSEEKKDDLSRLWENLLWIVDPIDWTKDFLNRTWEFSIMIWLVKNSRPILGVVFEPVKDRLFFAEKWKWSFLEKDWNIKSLSINKDNLDILVSRNHLTDLELAIIEKLNLKKNPCWSVWIKCSKIALWEAWNYLTMYKSLREWDSCAPEIILTEAWWKVTDIDGNELIYNKKIPTQNWFIWTNKVLHDFIINTIKWNKN